MRVYPGNVTRAGKQAGVDRKTARLWWNVGAPYEFAQRPMKELIEQEQLEARASLAAQELVHGRTADNAVGPSPEDVVKARGVLIEARVQEAQAVKLARGNAIGLLSATLNLVAAIGPLSRRITETLKTEEPTFQQGLNHMRQVTILAASAVSTAKDAMEMERLLLGDESPGTASALADTMTTEDAIAELSRASETCDRMRAAGRFVVIQGGRADVKPLEVDDTPPIPEALTAELAGHDLGPDQDELETIDTPEGGIDDTGEGTP